MIRFDEKAFAEKMHDTQGFINGYCLTELRIYAKWLKYEKLKELEKTYDDVLSESELDQIEKYIEKELIEFCERNYGAFNYVMDYKDIDYAVSSTRLHKLKLPHPLPVTKKEWETISRIDDDNLRRVAFVMLVDAKYFRYFSSSMTKKYEVTPDTVFYTQMENAEILKNAKAKFATKEEKMLCFFKLRKLGLIDATTGKAKAMYVKFIDVDPEAEIVGYVSDYDHLNLEYEKFSGGNIGKCKYCGRLFKQNNTGKIEYCYQHRGWRKKEAKFKKCVDCGSEFLVPPRSHGKVRCDSCQKNKVREYDRNRKSK